jgi:hypothetical protein
MAELLRRQASAQGFLAIYAKAVLVALNNQSKMTRTLSLQTKSTYGKIVSSVTDVNPRSEFDVQDQHNSFLG